jgi:large subunit ribosomal protein L24
MKIKTGDTVRIMVGKDKGKEGKVKQAFPKLGLVVVDGLRESVRHLKPKGKGANGEQAKGQRVTFNAPVRVSNVALVNGKDAGRVGYSTDKEGKKVRTLRAKKTTQVIG